MQRVTGALDALAAASAASRERLARADGADRAALVELLHASCLLEVSRLATAGLDLASYLQAAVDLIVGLYPVRGAMVTMSIAGLGEMTLSSGVPARDRPAHAVPIEGGGLGQLRLGAPTIPIDTTTFVDAVCDELGRGAAVVLEREVLRRRAALEGARRAAGAIDDADVDAGIADVVDALAALPGALAAELSVDHAGAGMPTSVRCGWWDDDGVDRPVSERATTGVRARVRWSGAGEIGDVGAVDAVIDEVARSLERIARTRRLEAETEHDPLTGLGNRRRLVRLLDAALTRATRAGEPVSVVLVDLDHFKVVNDRLGHHVGDLVLAAAAEAMRTAVRGYDEVFRSGGEEFVVLAPATDVVGARTVAERLRAQIPVTCATAVPEGWTQTASLGVAVVPDHAHDASGLLRAADRAMYRAKHAGRDQVAVAEVGDAEWLPFEAEPGDRPEPSDDDPIVDRRGVRAVVARLKRR